MRNVGYAIAILWITLLCVAGLLAGTANPAEIHLAARFSKPSAAHWLGRDELGRDVALRLVQGARYTLTVTGGASLFAVTLGSVLGIASAWRQGWLDRTVALLIDSLWAIPAVVAVILFVSVIGITTGSLILAIGCINWVTSARIFRSETARLRSSDSLRTVRAFGFGTWRLVVIHLVPQLRPVIVTVVGLCAVETITLETGLAFLGMRLPPPIPTWGGMLADGTPYVASAAWIVAAPTLALIFTLASIRVITSPRPKPAQL